MSSTPPPLRTEPDPAPAPEPRRKITCEFCQCVLTPSGEIVTMSEVTRGYRDSAEKHRGEMEKRDKELADLREQLAAKDREIAALKGSSTAKANFL
jgi:hypothetical protein